MREEIADLVHPVIHHALRLKERLDRGESPDFDAEQTKLKSLLLTEIESQRWLDFGGEPGQGSRPELEEEGRQEGERFLGIRYALVCWLDEFFILYSPWASRWNERKLEVELYGTNDRAWRFWRQAEIALTRPTNDALEALFLCVLFGFRGELRQETERLQAWITSTKTRIAKVPNQDWPYPLEYEPPTFVPPHFGRERLRNMILSGGIVLLLLIPLVTFFLVRQLGR